MFFAGQINEIEHSVAIFARLVSCLLGPVAVGDRKFESGSSLVILGISVILSRHGTMRRPEPGKVAGWCEHIFGTCAITFGRWGSVQVSWQAYVYQSVRFQACWENNVVRF